MLSMFALPGSQLIVDFFCFCLIYIFISAELIRTHQNGDNERLQILHNVQ